MEKEKLIRTSFMIFVSCILLMTYFIIQNLVFSQQNEHKNPEPIKSKVDVDVADFDFHGKNSSDLDIFGIKKIYPTKKGGFEWFLNKEDPESDLYLHNYKSIEKNKDRSFNIGERSRMGVYSKDGIGYSKENMETYNFTELSKKGYWYKPSDWKNVEITGEYLYKKGEGSGITHYARSEDHSKINNGCGGSSYKLKIHFDGTSSINKEQSHPKSWKIPINTTPFGKLDKDWFRFKGVIYNLPDGTVKLENWLDPFLNNTWTKFAEYQDKGAWGKDGNKCGGKEDHIITWGSPTTTFRWDDALVHFKNLSVREIQPPKM